MTGSVGCVVCGVVCGVCEVYQVYVGEEHDDIVRREQVTVVGIPSAIHTYTHKTVTVVGIPPAKHTETNTGLKQLS